jgi:hypothetical protein
MYLKPSWMSVLRNSASLSQQMQPDLSGRLQPCVVDGSQTQVHIICVQLWNQTLRPREMISEAVRTKEPWGVGVDSAPSLSSDLSLLTAWWYPRVSVTVVPPGSAQMRVSVHWIGFHCFAHKAHYCGPHRHQLESQCTFSTLFVLWENKLKVSASDASWSSWAPRVHPRSPAVRSVTLQFEATTQHEANFFFPTSRDLLKQSRAGCGLTALIFSSNTLATLCVAPVSSGGFDFEHFPGSNHIDQTDKRKMPEKIKPPTIATPSCTPPVSPPLLQLTLCTAEAWEPRWALEGGCWDVWPQEMLPASWLVTASQSSCCCLSVLCLYLALQKEFHVCKAGPGTWMENIASTQDHQGVISESCSWVVPKWRSASFPENLLFRRRLIINSLSSVKVRYYWFKCGSDLVSVH